MGKNMKHIQNNVTDYKNYRNKILNTIPFSVISTNDESLSVITVIQSAKTKSGSLTGKHETTVIISLVFMLSSIFGTKVFNNTFY